VIVLHDRLIKEVFPRKRHNGATEDNSERH
jgi:hypothetical protein